MKVNKWLDSVILYPVFRFTIEYAHVKTNSTVNLWYRIQDWLHVKMFPFVVVRSFTKSQLFSLVVCNGYWQELEIEKSEKTQVCYGKCDELTSIKSEIKRETMFMFVCVIAYYLISRLLQRMYVFASLPLPRQELYWILQYINLNCG